MAGTKTRPAKDRSARIFAQRCGAYLALAALALQLAASFAHIHKHDLARLTFGRPGVASVQHTLPTQQSVTQQPSRLADDDEDHCPICFSDFLLASSSLPDAQVSLRSLQFLEIDLAFNPASDRVVQPRRAAFLSRAPPAA